MWFGRQGQNCHYQVLLLLLSEVIKVRLLINLKIH